MTTLKEIAKRANVSLTTISRYVNEDETLSISENTKAAIDSVINQTGYVHTNKRKKQKKIAIISSFSKILETEDIYFSILKEMILSSVLEAKIPYDYFQDYFTSQNNFSHLANYSAVVVIGELGSKFEQKIIEHSKVIISIDEPLASNNIDSLYFDFRSSTFEALNYLSELGHENITFIGGFRKVISHTNKQSDSRYIAYKEWMSEHGLQEYEHLIECGWSSASAYEQTKLFIEDSDKNRLPSAFLVASDPLSVGVYKALNDLNYDIPNDFSIISFNNTEISQFLSPPLSSVALNYEELAMQLINLIKLRQADGKKSSVSISIKNELLIRESVTKITTTSD